MMNRVSADAIQYSENLLCSVGCECQRLGALKGMLRIVMHEGVANVIEGVSIPGMKK
jgi:hypothetical protein